MIRSGFTRAIFGKGGYLHSLSLSRRIVFGFAFPTQPSDYSNLKKLSSIMKIKELELNEEISYEGEVRLINSQNKQLGIMNFEEAYQMAQDMNLDIVLVNQQVKPAICKAINYKDEIYSKFAKEIISTETEMRNTDSKKPKKQVQVSINISNADLKTKAQISKEICKKSPQLKIFIQSNDAQEDVAKNILFTVMRLLEYSKNLVKDVMVSEYDLVVRSLMKDELDSDDIFNDKKATKQIELHLQTIEFNTKDQQIKKLVDQYLRDVSLSKTEDPSAEEVRTSRIFRQMEKVEGNDQLYTSDRSLEQQIKEFSKDIKDEEIDLNQDQYIKALESISQNQKRSFQEVSDEVENLRYRMQTSKEQALVLSLLQKEQKRLSDYKRTLKLSMSVRK